VRHHGGVAAKKGPTGTPALVVLEEAGVEYRVHEFEHVPSERSFGMAAAEALGADPAQVFKTLVAIVDGHPVVGIVAVDGQLSLKALAAAVGGKRAEMSKPADAERLTGYVVGGISPLGQKRLLRTVLDESAILFDTIFVSGGRRGLDIELPPDTLVTLLDASYAAIAG
jgi:Cys-tRNA(Pro)/Cys-tRNA(Cys) deacylase